MDIEEEKPFIPSPLPFLVVIFGYGSIVLLGILLMLPAFLLQAWVATILWGWFVIPFFKLPALPLAVALGLRFTIRTLYGNNPPIDNKNDGNTTFTRMVHGFTVAFVSPMIMLFMGYITHLYV